MTKKRKNVKKMEKAGGRGNYENWYEEKNRKKD